MKKLWITGICLLVSIAVGSCTVTLQKNTPQLTSDVTTATTTVADVSTTAVTQATTGITPSPTAAPSETTAAVPKVTPTNTASMYSSYANMVTYDPSNGWAEFDYFDMLKGDAAVQWLVDHEGYTQADAQAYVDGFADSEFVLKNINPQLRTVDLSVTPLKLMYNADGSMVTGADSVDASYEDLNTIYALNPDLILHSFFYYVTVTDGVVVSVEQVYWP